MINLLKYHFKKKWILIVVLSFVSLLITYLTNASRSYISSYTDIYELNIKYVYATNPPIITATVISAVLATIIPFVEFSFKMKKINIDQYYSLPIKREKLYLTNFIFGFIEIIIPVTVSYICGFLSIFSKPSMFENIYFLPYYFVLLFITFLVYSIVAFVYTRNNSFIDGFVNVIFIIFSLSILAGALKTIFNATEKFLTIEDYFNSSWYHLYSPHTYLSGIFDDLLCNGHLTKYYDDMQMLTVALPLFVVLGVTCFILFYIFSKREKAEDCLQTTKSFISFRTMIPHYIVTSIILLKEAGLGVMLLVSIAGFFLYVLHHKSFKFKLSTIITLVVSCVVSIVFALILEEIDQDNRIVIMETIFRGLNL